MCPLCQTTSPNRPLLLKWLVARYLVSTPTKSLAQTMLFHSLEEWLSWACLGRFTLCSFISSLFWARMMEPPFLGWCMRIKGIWKSRLQCHFGLFLLDKANLRAQTRVKKTMQPTTDSEQSSGESHGNIGSQETLGRGV